MMRDSSPPEATFVSGRVSSPLLDASISSMRSAPVGPSGRDSTTTVSCADAIPSSPSAAATSFSRRRAALVRLFVSAAAAEIAADSAFMRRDASWARSSSRPSNASSSMRSSRAFTSTSSRPEVTAFDDDEDDDDEDDDDDDGEELDADADADDEDEDEDEGEEECEDAASLVDAPCLRTRRRINATRSSRYASRSGSPSSLSAYARSES